MTDKTLPVVILGGYLGAGKTTLLNRLLREQHGLRLAVIVNDFGAVNVDADLVERRDGETIALTNGCICCGMSDGLIQVMYRLGQHSDALDGVVIETSGVADPARTAAFATLPGFRPEAVIVLADAERVLKLARDPLLRRSIQRQLEAADVVLVTKGDLVGPETTAAVTAWARERAPQARVVASPADQTPVDLLFDAETAPRTRPAPTVDDHDEQHEHHIDAYDRALARPLRPVSTDQLRAWYAALPEGVLRVKGWLRLTDAPTGAVVVQGVGPRLNLTPTSSDAEREPLLVLLGLPASLRNVTAPDGSPLDLAP